MKHQKENSEQKKIMFLSSFTLTYYLYLFVANEDAALKSHHQPSKADATPTHQQGDVPKPWVWEARNIPTLQCRRGVCCST